MPIKFDLKKYCEPGSVFIETGLWKCDGVLKALRVGFERIISIEVSSKILQDGQKKLAKHVASGRVSLLLGDSSVMMDKALEMVPDSKIVFWLDGHYQGVGPCTSNPLYAELSSICGHRRNGHTVLIDDRRLFTRSTWCIDEDVIKKILLESNPDYRFCYLRGYVPKDVFCAFVPH